jgi:acyl carrier protein
MSIDPSQEMRNLLAGMTGFEPEEVEDDMDLVKDLGIDSLKVIEIATAIEKNYGVVVKDNQLMRLKTVKEAIALLEELLNNKPEA